MHKQNFNMMHGFSFCVLVENYSLLIMFSHMSEEVDGKSHKKINSFISLIIWVLQAVASFGNSVTVGGLTSFGCSSAGQILASTVAAGMDSGAKGITLACSVIFIFSVSSTAVVLSKGHAFGL
jgi:hypothetical protein